MSSNLIAIAARLRSLPNTREIFRTIRIRAGRHQRDLFDPVRADAPNVRSEAGSVGDGDKCIVRHGRSGRVTYTEVSVMNSIVYIVGAVVIIMVVLSFLGLR